MDFSQCMSIDPQNIKQHTAEMMIYLEQHKLMDVISLLLAEIGLARPHPKNVEAWIIKNLPGIANRIYSNITEYHYRLTNALNYYRMPLHFLPRVVMFGRSGSGRKSQARFIVKHCKVLYIDVENLMLQGLRGEDALSVNLQHAYQQNHFPQLSKNLHAILTKRFCEADALHRGWVLVNYPHNLDDLHHLFERNNIPPNKFFYLKCSEDMAMKRLNAKPDLGSPQHNHSYMAQEMRYFSNNEEAIDEYLERRYETVLIDAEQCSEKVKDSIFFELDRVPYLMGFKPV